MIEISTDQKEKGQRQCGIKPSRTIMSEERAGHGHAKRQDDGQRNRHIHVEPPSRQRAKRRGEEGRPEYATWNRYHRRDQVKQMRSCRCRAGPDRNGQKHHVHHREARHADPEQQVTIRGILTTQKRRVETLRAVPGACESVDHDIGVDAATRDEGALERQVDARLAHAWQRVQRLFNTCDTGRAVDVGQMQHEVGCDPPASGRLGQRDAGRARGVHARTHRRMRFSTGVPSGAVALTSMRQRPGSR